MQSSALFLNAATPSLGADLWFFLPHEDLFYLGNNNNKIYLGVVPTVIFDILVDNEKYCYGYLM